jgi:Cu-Zn family superoxide dismutase
MKKSWWVLGLGSGLVAIGAQAAGVVVPMDLVDEKGVVKAIGTVTVTESPYGLVFTPKVEGLPAGLHGFHVHENGSCAPAEQNGKPVPALAAGGHLDPKGSKRHAAPWGDGHLGDLPALTVEADGKATNPVLAPRPKLADVLGRSLMIHVGGDNHADHPMPLGGGGARLACGVIPATARADLN